MASTQGERKFVRQPKEYSLPEKKELENLKALEGKTTYEYRRKKHVQMKPRQDFLADAKLCILYFME